MSYVMTPPWVAKRRMMVMATKRGRGRQGHDHSGGFPMGPASMRGGRPKIGRGDVRVAILHLLSEKPMHGYQIMQELSDRTDGMWKPSPGSVYPTLAQLEDEELVAPHQRNGKNVFALTDSGRQAVDGLDAPPPWERFGEASADGVFGLREAGFKAGAAAMQVARSGSERQIERTKDVLEEARRQIYQILAEDE